MVTGYLADADYQLTIREMISAPNLHLKESIDCLLGGLGAGVRVCTLIDPSPDYYTRTIKRAGNASNPQIESPV